MSVNAKSCNVRYDPEAGRSATKKITVFIINGFSQYKPGKYEQGTKNSDYMQIIFRYEIFVS
jgi:hypothetical protein